MLFLYTNMNNANSLRYVNLISQHTLFGGITVILVWSELCIIYTYKNAKYINSFMINKLSSEVNLTFFYLR